MNEFERIMLALQKYKVKVRSKYLSDGKSILCIQIPCRVVFSCQILNVVLWGCDPKLSPPSVLLIILACIIIHFENNIPVFSIFFPVQVKILHFMVNVANDFKTSSSNFIENVFQLQFNVVFFF